MSRRVPFTSGTSVALVGSMLVALAILGVTAVVDRFAGEAYRADIRAIVSGDADTLARNLSDVVARESSAVDALAAFVENHLDDPEGLQEEFSSFAAALMEFGSAIKSLQVAPGGILDFVHPIEGNEAAVGLDLMADDDRRALLEPAIESGSTVVQGPVELVQGGLGLIVRRPIYDRGAYWGFSAVVLDWPTVAERSGLSAEGVFTIAGVKSATGEVIAGSSEAFQSDPIVRQLEVGGTDTTWILAVRPIDGWPQRAAEAPFIWAAGLFLALVSGLLSFSLIRRPEVLRRERERALQNLEALEARYRATFQNAGVGIVLAEVSGRILSANPKFREIVGVEEDDAIERVDVLSMMGEKHRNAYRSGMKRLLAGVSTVFEEEVRISTSNFERWCRVRTTLIPGGSIGESLVIAIVEDSTQRHIHERALANSELRFRQLFELAPIAIQREDHSAVKAEVERLADEGVTDIRAFAAENPGWLRSLLARIPIVDENPAATRLQRSDDKGDHGLTLAAHYTREAESTFIESVVAVSEGRSQVNHEVETRGPNGAPLHLGLRWQAPVVNGEPDYSNVMVTLADVTELRETGRRLEELMESKDRFLASVAHELRTPLTAVVGFAEELRDPGGIYSAREKAEFQELIAFHGAEMANIIEDLLVWARGDIGEVQVTCEPMYLSRGVRQTLRVMPNIEIPIHEDGPPFRVMADPGRVRQIVRNLATNALRYGGDSIEVRIRGDNGYGIVEVSDDGPQIPPATRQRMFEPYERAQVASSQPGSIGLGLTVARTLARLQHGDLVCVREGSQNIFRLTLPLADDDIADELDSPTLTWAAR